MRKWITNQRGWKSAAAVAVLVAVIGVMGASYADEDLLQAVKSDIVPTTGTPTSYGIPLSLESLSQFVGWWYTLVPIVQTDARYAEALKALVAPCCDDNTAFRCCCETEEGQACNIIRSGKGLAAHLILDLQYTTDQVRDSVLQWFQFARWDYYVAAEMVSRGVNPEGYGLTTQGSCYRGLCDTPISLGGCGGMQQLIEPAIGAAESF